MLKRKLFEQECIPVGCVPSAAVAVSASGPGGVSLWSRGRCLPLVLRGGVYTPPWTDIPPGQTPPLPSACWDTHPTVDRMADARENITFTQLLLRTVKMEQNLCILHDAD